MFKGLHQYDTLRRSEEGAWLTLKDPETFRPIEIDGTNLRILVAGSDSERHHRMIHDTRRAEQQARQGDPTGYIPVDVARRLYAEQIAKIVLAWEGFLGEDDRPLPCTSHEVERLFVMHPWARDQVDTFAATRGNFVAKNGPSSSPPSPSDSGPG